MAGSEPAAPFPGQRLPVGATPPCLWPRCVPWGPLWAHLPAVEAAWWEGRARHLNGNGVAGPAPQVRGPAQEGLSHHVHPQTVMTSGVHPSHSCCLAFFPELMLGVCPGLPHPAVGPSWAHPTHTAHTWACRCTAPPPPDPREPRPPALLPAIPASVRPGPPALFPPAPTAQSAPAPRGRAAAFCFSILGVSGRQRRRKHVCERAVPWMFNQGRRDCRAAPGRIGRRGLPRPHASGCFRWGCAGGSRRCPRLVARGGRSWTPAWQPHRCVLRLAVRGPPPSPARGSGGPWGGQRGPELGC